MPKFHKVQHSNFTQIEHQILKYWEENQVFEKLRQLNTGKKPWSFLDGPITANNPMGVHHAWGRTLKDVFHRYFAMNRRECRYQNGFDCQGLWVEIEVEKELGLKTKADIEQYGLEKFTEACKQRVLKYSKIQTEQSKRLGYWMDWDNSYFTMSDENNYTIWKFLKTCHEKGYLYKGTDVMPWSGRAGCAYSDMEVKEGRKLTIHTSVFVRFPLRNRPNEYLLVWTTTPWTLPGNVGCAVNGNLNYLKVRSKKDQALYYVAAENFNYQRLEKEFKEGFSSTAKWPLKSKLKTIAQFFKEQGGFDLEGTIKGTEMVGWSYDGPYDHLPAQQQRGGWAQPIDLIPTFQRNWKTAQEAHIVIDPGIDTKGNPYVLAGEGTGIVHIAPGCGDVDHLWGTQHQLVSIAPLDENGLYISGFDFLTGLNPTAKSTVDLILTDLKARGFLFAKEDYPHIYPHCWRTGDELVYRLVDEWFISMDWRDEIKKTAQQINWLPAQMKGGERELDWLTTMRDWMISKKRYWGLALPIWECKQCQHLHVIGSKEELQHKAVEGWELFEGNSPHRPYIDQIKIACEKCGSLTSRIPDVGNPWLDAGIVAYSTTKFNSDPEYWQKWIPADLVTECFPGQFRNWFYAILAMSTMMELGRETQLTERKIPFKNLLGHHLVMNEQGQQMHKSDGTAIWFEEAAEQIGVDTMRWLYCAQRLTEELKFGLRHPTEPIDVVIGDQTISQTTDGARFCKVTSKPADLIRRKLLTYWNSYIFFCNYAHELDLKNKIKVTDRPLVDQWILALLQKTILQARAAFEQYDVTTVCSVFENFLENLSNWYIRCNRTRFTKKRTTSFDQQAALQTLHTVLVTFTKLVAPLIPFMAEEIYLNLEDGPSVHLTEYPQADESLLQETLLTAMENVQELISIGRSLRKKANLGVRQPLSELIFASSKASTILAYQNLILEELNLKSLVVVATTEFEQYQTNAQYLSSENSLAKVALNTVLTAELRQEGIVREVVREIQNLRKKARLNVEDLILLHFQTQDIELQEILVNYKETIQEEVLAVQIDNQINSTTAQSFEIKEGLFLEIQLEEYPSGQHTTETVG